MVGSVFPYSEFLPTTGQVKAVQIDLSAADAVHPLPDGPGLGRRRQGHPGRAAAAAAAQGGPLVAGGDQRERHGVVAADGRARPARPISTAASGRRACSPSLSRHLPDNAILSSDSGTAANWYARHIRIRRGMKAMLSGNLATMVPGVPYAIAAKFAFPDRVSVAMVGDGAMQMGGMAEMLTAAKYYKTWADPRSDRARAQQRGPQPGHLGAAGHGGRPPLRGLPGDPVRVLRRLGQPDRAERDQGHPLRSDRGRLATRRSPPTDR